MLFCIAFMKTSQALMLNLIGSTDNVSLRQGYVFVADGINVKYARELIIDWGF